MDFVPNPTLQNISIEVDRLWAARVTAIKKSNTELQPHVYSAWKLLTTVHKGRPKAGQESFSSWIAARKIPRQTGYDILNRERVRLDEISVRAVQFSHSTDTGELDVDDAQGGTPEAQYGPVLGPVAIEVAVAPPAVPLTVLKPATLDLNTATAAQLMAERERLVAELKTYVKDEVEAQKIMDRGLIQFLQDRLGPFRTKRNVRSMSRELTKAA